MKKDVSLIVSMVVILHLLGISTGLLVVDPSKLSTYFNILLVGLFGIVGGELLKLLLKREPD